MKKCKLIILSICSALLIGALSNEPAHALMKSLNHPPDSLLKNADGNEIQKIIKRFEGKKAVLVNVWATWCGPCIEEFPDIVKLQKKYPERLKVIFVSADFPENREKAKRFLKEHKVNWATYFKTGKDQPFIEAISSEWTGALPFTKVIGKSGTVVKQWERKASYNKFERNINPDYSPRNLGVNKAK